MITFAFRFYNQKYNNGDFLGSSDIIDIERENFNECLKEIKKLVEFLNIHLWDYSSPDFHMWAYNANMKGKCCVLKSFDVKFLSSCKLKINDQIFDLSEI